MRLVKKEPAFQFEHRLLLAGMKQTISWWPIIPSFTMGLGGNISNLHWNQITRQ